MIQQMFWTRDVVRLFLTQGRSSLSSVHPFHFSLGADKGGMKFPEYLKRGDPNLLIVPQGKCLANISPKAGP